MGELGNFRFVKGKGSPVCPPTPVGHLHPLLQPGEASRQSELIAAHSGKSSLVSPHMVTRCVARRDSRAGEAARGEQRGDPFECLISRLCFQVYCVRDTGGEGVEKDERLPVQSRSGL